jgi:protein-disulfide isomerase
MNRYLPILIIVGVLIVAIGASTLLFRAEKQEQEETKTAPQTSEVSRSISFINGADPPNVKGDATAPVSIEEFADFQCPSCSRMSADLAILKAKHGNKLRVIFRNYPLERLHKNAILAARSAEAAGLQKKFWEMHDLIFRGQQQWSDLPANQAREILRSYARNLNLNMAKFDQDMDGSNVRERILLDQQRGNALGVTSTPTIFVNGKEVQAMQFEELEKIVDTALKENS